jgi:hypothetical protein
VLVIALIAVARLVTPIVVPIVVPTALTHQNTTIAMVAIVFAKCFGRESRRPIMAYPPFLWATREPEDLQVNPTTGFCFIRVR